MIVFEIRAGSIIMFKFITALVKKSLNVSTIFEPSEILSTRVILSLVALLSKKKA